MQVASPHARQQREAMTACQVCLLFTTLLADGAPWAAVCCLLQIALGERGGCSTEARESWLEALSPEAAGAPAVSGPEGEQKDKTSPHTTARGPCQVVAQVDDQCPVEGGPG